MQFVQSVSMCKDRYGVWVEVDVAVLCLVVAVIRLILVDERGR